MSHLALYRAWRPQNFDDVVAQEQVVYPLRQAVISGEIGHAYLFCGTRGTGKTSLAKIFAKAVNCLEAENGNPCNHCKICEGINKGSLLDVVEIDAASNNSVDNIRRITDEAQYMPSEARYKVYIIDEVHMLSGGAFNALLKTLEEPPAHVIFILATTEVQRIPATILSRCQRYEFHRIAQEDIVAQIDKVSKEEKIDISAEAEALIARLADGALRDALSILDQCRSGVEGRIEEATVRKLAGLVDDSIVLDLLEAFFDRHPGPLLQILDKVQMSGKKIQRFLEEVIEELRNLLVLKVTVEPGSLLNVSQETEERLRALAQRCPASELMELVQQLVHLLGELRYSAQPKLAIDLALLAAMQTPAGSGGAGARASSAVADPIGSKQAAAAVPTPGLAAAVAPAPKLADPIGSKQTATAVPAPGLAAAVVPAPKAEHAAPGEGERAGKKQAPSVAASAAESTLPSGSQPQEKASDAAAATSLPAADVSHEALWQETLKELKRNYRFDLAMLLRPARVSIADKDVRILYQKGARAHCQAVRRPENQSVLRTALEKAGLPAAQLHFLLEGEAAENEAAEKAAEAPDLNPQEPLWVQKLRASSKALGVELTIETAAPPPEELNPLDLLPPDEDQIPF